MKFLKNIIFIQIKDYKNYKKRESAIYTGNFWG